MYVSRNFLIALFAAFVVAVTYVDVLNDLRALDDDIKKLGASCNAYTGTGSQTLAIRNQIKRVQADLDYTIMDVNAATSPSAADASTIYSYIAVTPLYPDTTKALNIIVAKKSIFINNGVLVELCSYVKDLKSRYDKLLDVLIAKAPNQDLKTKGAAAKSNYDAAFNSAISTLGPC